MVDAPVRRFLLLNRMSAYADKLAELVPPVTTMRLLEK